MNKGIRILQQKNLIIFSVLGVLALVLFIALSIAVVGIIGAVVLVALGVVKFNKTKKEAEAKIAQLNQNYDQLIATGSKMIEGSLEQWATILSKVAAHKAAGAEREILVLDVPKEVK